MLIRKESAWAAAQRIFSDPVLLHAIKVTLDNTRGVESSFDLKSTKDTLADIIEQVEGLYNNDFPSIDQLAEGMAVMGATVQRWIPCDEFLPKKSGSYFVRMSHGAYGCLNYSTRYGVFNASDDCEYPEGLSAIKCSHWMPIPKGGLGV